LIELVIPGAPIAKKRPKFGSRGGFIRVYNPSKQDQNGIERILQSMWNDRPIETPIELDVTFYMPIPASWSKKRRIEALNKKHCTVCDVDNLLKTYLDCMNEIVYVDDRQIYKVTAVKRYDDNPRTVINVMWKDLPSYNSLVPLGE